MDPLSENSQPAWLPATRSSTDNPHMTLAFARAYEQTATRITAPISVAALERLGNISRDTRILDIAAGSGAFAVPAAHADAGVTAIDIAPGMVELLTQRLAPFPRARAEVMDGQKLDFTDGSFDAAVSIFGVSIFPDWRQGLAEQVRVLRPGGIAILATWRSPPGGGPFEIMAEALRTTFADRPPPTPPEGFVRLPDPKAMADALVGTGLIEVEVEEIEAVWEGPAGAAYLEELRAFHPFMGPYALLDVDTKHRLDQAILAAVGRRAENDRIVLKTMVTLAKGRQA